MISGKKIADVSRTTRVCHVIQIFSGTSQGKVQLKFHHCKVCVTDLKEEEGSFLHPPLPPHTHTSVSGLENAHPEQG